MFLSLDSFRRPVPRLNRANSANSLHFADYHPSAPPLAASLKDSLVHLSPLSFPTPRSRLDFVHSLLDALASPSGNSTIVLEFLDFESSTATRNILVLIRWTNDALETADFAFLAAIVNLFSCILLSPLVIPSMDTHFKDIWRGTFVSCSVALNRRERPSNFQALSHRASTLSNFITTNNRSLLSHAHPAAIHSVPHPCYRASSYHGGANSGASVTHSSDVTLFKLAAPTAEARHSTSSILRRSRVKRHGVSSSLYRVRWAGWIKDNEHVRREVPLLKVPIKVEVWTDADEIDDDDDDGVFL